MTLPLVAAFVSALLFTDRSSPPGTLAVATLSCHEGAVKTLRFDREGKILTSLGRDGRIRHWDVSTWRLLPPPSHEGRANCMTYPPDPEHMVVGGECGIDGLNKGDDRVEGGRLLTTVPASSLDCSPDGGMILSGDVEGMVRFWDAASGVQRGSLRAHRRNVASLQFGPDGKSWASLGWTEVRLWKSGPGPLPSWVSILEGQAFAMAYSPDGRALFVGGRDGIIRVWDVSKGDEREQWMAGVWITALATSPDGSLLALGGADGTVDLWDVRGGNRLTSLRGQTSWISSLAFSPDQKSLASGSWDSSVLIWSVAGVLSHPAR